MTCLPASALGANTLALSEAETQSLHAYLSAEKAVATRRAYQSDWKGFAIWCEQRGAEPLPARAETICAFLAHEAERGLKASSLSRSLAAIRYAHKLASVDPLPTDSEAVRAVLRGIRRTKGTRPEQKAPATAEIVKTMITHCPQTLAGLRDKAILLLGFAGAFRRSELSALHLSDLEFVKEGLRVTLRRSKTDATGQGFVKPILHGATPSTCPVAAITAWIKAARIEDGFLFRRLGKGERVEAQALSGYSIGLIVKDYAAKVGLDPDTIGGHSLRAGFCTSAAMAGADAFKIMDVSGHKSVQTLRGYVRRADEFRNHAGSGLL